MLDELRLALLERDRVHHRLALDAFQAGLDHREFRGIDHHRHAGDVGLGRDQVEEGLHRLRRVEKAFVHVDVDDLRAALDLLAGDRQRRGVVARGDELAELGRAGDVGALADVHERDFRRERERLEPRKPQERLRLGHGARRFGPHRFRNRADVLRRRAAAAADDVDQPGLGELAEMPRHVVRAFVIVAELVRQAGIRIGADQRVAHPRHVGDVRAHLLGAERAVQSDRDRIGVPHRVPERLRRLAGEQPPRTVGDGAGDHDRHVDAADLALLHDRVDRGLGVERVEDGLDQQHVGAAGESPRTCSP